MYIQYPNVILFSPWSSYIYRYIWISNSDNMYFFTLSYISQVMQKDLQISIKCVSLYPSLLFFIPQVIQKDKQSSMW